MVSGTVFIDAGKRAKCGVTDLKAGALLGLKRTAHRVLDRQILAGAGAAVLAFDRAGGEAARPRISWSGRPIKSIAANLAPGDSSRSSYSTSTPAPRSLA